MLCSRHDSISFARTWIVNYQRTRQYSRSGIRPHSPMSSGLQQWSSFLSISRIKFTVSAVVPKLQEQRAWLSTASSIKTLTEGEESLAGNIADGSFAPPKRYHGHSSRRPRHNIYEMNSESISKLRSLDDLEDIVAQVEAMTVLESADIDPLIAPLTRATSMKLYGQRGATLTQTLLLNCLSRLPASVEERYSETHLEKSSDGLIRSTLPYPPASMYNRAIIAMGNAPSRDNAERAESIFQLQLQEYTREKEYLLTLHGQAFESDNSMFSNECLPLLPFAQPPDRRCYKSLIRAWATSKDEMAAKKADAILYEMEQQSDVPTILKAYRRKDKTQPTGTVSSSPSRQDMSSTIDMPDLSTYNLVMGAYARSYMEVQKPVAINRVREIMNHVDELYAATENENYILDGHSWISILQTYHKWIAIHAPPLHPGYAHELIAILHRIHERIEITRNCPSEPTPSARSWLDSNATKDDNSLEPDRNFIFPMSMAFAYGVLIAALIKTPPFGETLLLADDIVMALAGQRNRLNDGSGTAPLSIPYYIAEKSNPSNDTLVQITNAWERSGHSDAERRIQRILYMSVVDRPYHRIHQFNEALNEWSYSGCSVAPQLLESMLSRALEKQRYTRNKPTGESFAIVMKAWMRSRKEDCAHKVELLLQHMLWLYEVKGDIWYRPIEIHTRYLFLTWNNMCHTGKRYDGISGNKMYPAEHCERLILLFKGQSWFAENLHGQYAMAIRAWASQEWDPNEAEEDLPNPVQRAVTLLDSLRDHVPDGESIPAYPGNWVLETCCRKQPNAIRRQEAFLAAIETVERTKHNPRTYVLTARALREQVPQLEEEHMLTLEDLFTKACSCGMLSQELIAEIIQVARPATLQKLFGISFQLADIIVSEQKKPIEERILYSELPNSMLVQNLPVEWSVNNNTQRKIKAPDVLHAKHKMQRIRNKIR